MSASAGLEKIAAVCNQKICFHWWPKLPTIEGWRHDRDYSLHYNFNALAPVGISFSIAETVMYSNAIYRPRVPDDRTLEQFIDGDTKKFRDTNPGLKIEETLPLKTGDAKVVRSFVLIPTASGQWERVSYLEEGDYYVVFVVSSRSESGLNAAMFAYEKLVANYRE